MQNCNNSCDAVAGLNEAAANLIQYRNLINTWVNGDQNTTVNIGGVQTPSLRNLAMAIKQLVGVWPDDITIKIDPAKKIYVPLKPQGGVHVGDNGLFIDSSDFLQLGGGLAKDASGKIYVDFGSMPTDKFEALLKTLRLPIWLTGNTNFYVNKTHAAAADTLDEGRGLSAAKPFLTIQACWDFIAANYNLGNYNAVINVASGEYVEDLQFGSYTAASGGIIILGQEDFSTKIRGYVGMRFCNKADFRYCDFRNRTGSVPGSSAYRMFLVNDRSSLYLRTCKINLDTNSDTTSIIFNSIAGSNIELRAMNAGENGMQLTYSASLGDFRNVFFVDAANLYLCTEMAITGTLPITGAFCQVTAAGNYSNEAMGSGMKAPKITGSATGRRYAVQYNGICRVNGAGPEFFPGSQAGTASTGGQYA